MNDVLILGTVALDTIETPFGKLERGLGGSATYASISASMFSKPAIMSIIGRISRKSILRCSEKNIDTSGIKISGKTFHWEGFYEFDMNEAKTRKTELNSLADFKVTVPESYKEIKHVFFSEH